MKIAVDGPASSGKSTIAKIIASKLNILYIDTGAMYRAITLSIIKNKISINNINELNNFLLTQKIHFELIDGKQEVFLNNELVTNELRSNHINDNVSEISANAIVRKHLVKEQQEMAVNHSVIMDGRDIGTVVLKDADYKFYLVASSKVRAQRRYLENLKEGYSSLSLEEIENSINERDNYDMNRLNSPLKKANDAIEIDTSNLSIEEVVNKMLAYINLN